MRAIVLSAVVLACSLPLAPDTSAQTDFARPIFETGGAATAFAYGDLNGDGRPDAAVVHSFTDKLGLVLGKPGGRFGPPTLINTGDEPRAVAIVDFDQVGPVDIVVFNENAGTLTLVLRAGASTVVSTHPAGGNGDVLAAGDLDGDGDADVVTGNYDQKTLSIVEGLGALGFAAPVTYPASARPLSIALEDFDGDGALDVVTSNFQEATLTLRLGDGRGGLLAETTLATAAIPGGLAAADLDADGDLDLATGSNTDLIVVRNGPAGFASPEITPVGATIHVVTASDFDDDGLVDLLVNASTLGGDALSRMSGTGGGAFAAPVELLDTSLSALAVDDADDDLRLDVVGATGGLCVFRGDGAGGLVSSPPVALAEQAAIFALADLDGDGFDDLVSANSIQSDPFSVEGPVHVQLGDGEGGWGPPQLQPVDAVDFIELADVTGDGQLDLLTTVGFSAWAIAIAAGDGAGGFAEPTLLSLPSQEASALKAADLDVDGDVDLAVLSIEGGFMGTQLRHLLGFRNDGGGQWTTYSVFYSSAGQFAAEDRLVLGDCNGDGRPDAIVLDRASNTLRFIAGDGNQWGSALSLGPAGTTGGEHPHALHDLNGDGLLDIVVAANSVQVRYGEGNGIFGAAQTLGAGPGDDVRVVDFDGDGSLDIMMDGSAGDVASDTVMVWHANGSGGFDRQRYFSEWLNRSFVIDADQDGRLDLLAVPAYDEFLHPEPRDAHVLSNHTLSAAFTDFGHGLAGSFGVPSLVGQGTLAAGSPGSLKLTGANPNKLAVLFIGATANPTPFKGGLLVPVPPAIMFTLFTSPTGTITVGWSSWKLMPPGTDWFFQYGIVDSAGPAGASLSNALRALQA